jgi:hypothetical protein
MHKNTFLTTPDVKKIFFKDLILVVWKCIKTRLATEVNKIIFLGLDSGGMEVCANA